MRGRGSSPDGQAQSIFQHPLAYLLALEGIALLRGFAGEYDREFTLARLAEVRRLLDVADEIGDGAVAEPISTVDGYRGWADFYDQPGNMMVDLEEPVVHEIVDGLPVGVAVDAACGTGRHSAYLAALGHTVIGVDSSPEMLAKAVAKLPDVDFRLGDLHALPVPDHHADVVVCGLALMHVPELEPVFAEFVRVLKPGGHLVVSDSRGLFGIPLPVLKEGADGRLGYLPAWIRRDSEYLAVALPLGLQVRRCVEPRRPVPLVDGSGTPPGDGEPAEKHVPGDQPDIWSLHPWCPDATNATYRDTASSIIWHFHLPR